MVSDIIWHLITGSHLCVDSALDLSQYALAVEEGIKPHL